MTAPANPLICEECKLTLDNSDEVIVGERPRDVHDRPRKAFWHKACWTRDEQGAREIDRGRLEAVIRRQFV
jgi:hypothetical protein